MIRWITKYYYIDVETSERIAGKRRVEEEYTIIRKKKNIYYDDRQHARVIEYTVECIRRKYKQGELFK